MPACTAVPVSSGSCERYDAVYQIERHAHALVSLTDVRCYRADMLILKQLRTQIDKLEHALGRLIEQ